MRNNKIIITIDSAWKHRKEFMNRVEDENPCGSQKHRAELAIKLGDEKAFMRVIHDNLGWATSAWRNVQIFDYLPWDSIIESLGHGEYHIILKRDFIEGHRDIVIKADGTYVKPYNK